MNSAGRISKFSSWLCGSSGLALLGGGALTYNYYTAHADTPRSALSPHIPEVYLWGDNSKGLIASGPLAASAIRTPTRVPFLSNQKLRSLAICPDYAVAAVSTGDVVQWTSPEEHSLVLKSKNIRQVLVSPQSHVAIALSHSGSVYTWSAASPEKTPLKLEDKLRWFEKIVDIKCGVDHLVALTNKGRVFTAALQAKPDHDGQLGIASFPHFESLPPTNTLHRVKLLDMPVSQIAAGFHHSLFLTNNNELYGCGSNKHGQLMLPYTIRNTKISVPTRLPVAPPGSTIKAIAAGSAVTYFNTVNHSSGESSWFVAGDGEFGHFGTGSFAQCQVSPLRVSAIENMREYDESVGMVVPMNVAAMNVGETHVFAAINNAARDWLVWGSNERGQLGNNKLSKLVKPMPVANTIVSFPDLGATNFVTGSKVSGCYMEHSK